MGIITRFKDIMSANINALLDKAENPEKMLDQYLRNLESDLGKVKAETAAVMAEETRAKRELDEVAAEINKYQKYAEKALAAGNEEDARQFLTKKAQLTEQQTTMKEAYDLAAANSLKMRQMHDKLSKDISELNGRKAAIKAKIAAAKAQEKINKAGSGITGVSNNMSVFDKAEAKANRMLDEANAMAELNSMSAEDDIEALVSKYDEASPESPAVDDELQELKAKLGI